MIRKSCLAVCMMVQSYQINALELYAGVDANYIQNKISVDAASAEFKPLAVSGRVGAYLEPQLGLEFYGMTGAADDKDNDIEVDLSYSLGVALRFESPESEGGKVFFVLGYGLTELNINRSGTDKPGKEEFDGFTYGGGVEFSLDKSNHLYMNLQAVRYYSEDDIDIDGVSIGLRYRY